MKTVLLTSVVVEAAGGAKVDLAEGYENYLVFYPSSGLYLNIELLNAQAEGKLIHCSNHDDRLKHELWIVQFNHPLPPIFNMEPWQILLKS